MKKISSLLAIMMMLLAIPAIFTSCKDDEESNPPTLAFEAGTGYVSSNATVNANEAFTVGVRATANATSNSKLVNFKFELVSGSERKIMHDSTFSSSTYLVDYPITLSTAGTYTLYFTVKDKAGESTEKTLTITVKAATVDEINAYTAKILAAQDASGGSAFASTTGAVFTKADAKTNAAIVDFIYYYSTTASTGAEMISPKYAQTNYSTYVSGWSVLNETKFTGLLTSVDFAAIATGADIAALVTNPSNDRATTLVVGSTFGFKTAAGKLAVAKVTALSGTTAGSITIDVKVQK